MELVPVKLKQIKEPFNDKDYLYEIKSDGFRGVLIKDGETKLYSRSGNRLDYPTIIKAFEKIDRKIIIDGELVSLINGKECFKDLLRTNPTGEIKFQAFDLLFDKENLCELPLIERKKRLKKILPKSPEIVYVDHIEFYGKELFDLVCKNKMEGIIAKKKESKYIPGITTKSWIKIKNKEYRR